MSRLAPGEAMAVAGDRLDSWRRRRLDEGQHSDRTAAVLGIALGACFAICFSTGLLSHFIQHPVHGFSWTTRPAWLFRVTQGLHVTTGIAAIPLLFAKLWSVFPRLFQWPPATDVIHAVERLSLLPLVGGSLFMLVTGLANIDLWYPWVFFFPAGHYAVSYVVIGSLVIHVVAKLPTTRDALHRRRRDEAGETSSGVTDRRRFLATTGLVSAGLVAITAGQTVWPLRRLALLAPRRPDIGTQGFPVNKTAPEAGVTKSAVDPGFRLEVKSAGTVLRRFTVEELRAMPVRTAKMPIACVEGWSANRLWTGVSVRDILTAAGAPTDRSVSVQSLQRAGRYRQSTLTAGQHADKDTLLAFEVDGVALHPDHGFPLRLIAPARPGVLQTKWVHQLVVR